MCCCAAVLTQLNLHKRLFEGRAALLGCDNPTLQPTWPAACRVEDAESPAGPWLCPASREVFFGVLQDPRSSGV